MRKSEDGQMGRIFLYVFALCAAAAIVTVSGCQIKKKIPADPALVKAFQDADAIISSGANATEADVAFGGQVSAALETFAGQLMNQKGRFPNARQAADLQKLTQEVSALAATSGNIGYDRSGGAPAGLYKEWQALKPRLRPFVGPAAD